MATLAVVYRIGADITQLESGMRRAAKATEGLERKADNMGAMFTRVGRLMAGAFTATAIIGAAREAARFADELQALSQMTGVSTDALQVFNFAGKAANVELNEVANAVVQLNRRLGSRESGAIGAISMLGLSVSHLVAMGPEKSFLAVAKAVDSVEDPMRRSALQVELFGRMGPRVAAVAREFDAAKRSAEELNGVLSPDQVQALGELNDKYERSTLLVKAWSAQLTIGVIDAAGIGKDTLGNLAEGVLNVGKAAVAALNPKKALGQAFTALAAQTQGANIQLKATTAELPRQLTQADLLTNALNALRSKAIEPLTALEKDYIREAIKHNTSQQQIVEVTGRSSQAIGAYIKALEKSEEATEAINKKTAQWRDSVRDLTFETNLLASVTMPKVDDQAAEVENAMNGLTVKGFIPATDGIVTLHQGLLEMNGQMGLAPNVIGKTREEMEELTTVTRSLGDSFDSLLSGDFKAVFSDIGGFFKGGLKSIGTGLLEGIGSGILGMVSNLAIKGLSALGGWLSNLFGGKDRKATKELREFGAELISSVGGIEQMRIAAQLFGSDIETALHGKGVKGLERAKVAAEKFAAQFDKLKAAAPGIQDLVNRASQFGQGLPERFQPFLDQMRKLGLLTDEVGFDFEHMRDVAEKYGIDLSALGTKFQSARLHASAEEIINDFELLVSNGADVDAVLAGMSDEINAIVNDSIKFGTSIPLNMKPWIEKLMESGQLLDENGVKITDISKLKFGDPIVAGLDGIIARLDKLLKGLGIDLPKVIDDLPDSIDIPINFPTGPFPDFPEPIPMASGGAFHVTKPTLFLAGEAGAEDVAFSGANRSFGGGGDGVTVVHTSVSLDGREVARIVDRHLSEGMRQKRIARSRV